MQDCDSPAAVRPSGRNTGRVNDHFSAFSFVDRIHPGRSSNHISGSYFVAPGVGAFPACLAAEAVGQLAAWAAMAAVDFEQRPVAGIASRFELLNSPPPGQWLDLWVDIETIDSDAIAYSGTASANGIPIIRLQHCVGPMVAVAEFDDPQALRERFALLCGPGAAPGRFGGIPPLIPDRTGGEAGGWATAVFQVPTSGAFFADHFPRRPVFPGSLLMQVKLELARALASDAPPAPGAAWVLSAVLDMKLRAFIPPGKILQMEARFADRSSQTSIVALETRSGERQMGSARVLMISAPIP